MEHSWYTVSSSDNHILEEDARELGNGPEQEETATHPWLESVTVFADF